MNTDPSHLRQAAETAADAAAVVIRNAVDSGDWGVTMKADDTPVTEVDVAAERAIRSVLQQAAPQAAFFGEETGKSDGVSTARSDESASAIGRSLADPDPDDALRWLVDPIDGTKSFVRGMPFYSTQIALERAGVLSIGVSHAPAWNERLVAVAGEGVWLNDKPVRCRRVTTLGEVYLSAGNLTTLAGNASRWSRYGELITQVRRLRGYGDFCHYHQLCCGQTDLIIESDVNILDIAALTVAVREAGGVITDLEGAPINDDTTSVLAAATPELHASVLGLLL